MITQLEQFRTTLYNWLRRRADALMDLVDALSSSIHARSVVELSLSFMFRRQYASVHDGIENLFVPTSEESSRQERQALEQDLVRGIVPHLPTPQQPFHLLGTDVTSAPRPFARTLSERTFVYQPNTTNGVNPIAIGHQYSVLALLPHKDSDAPPWVVPLLVNRVTSTQTKREAGLEQIHRLLDDSQLPFGNELCVSVADSDYSALPYLWGVSRHDNLVTVARLASNRTLLRSAKPSESTPRKGHPTWYGTPMKLNDPSTWSPPDDVYQTSFSTRKGKTHTLHLEGWSDLLVRGRRGIPMQKHPFTLIRGSVLDEQGKRVFAHNLWLVVFGARRSELSLIQAWNAYRQRYDLEHFFRFGKQHLLMGAYQTPETQHEENWWTIVQLAYLQLWAARDPASILPRPWERYLPNLNAQIHGTASPSIVQRDMERILRHFGTPACDPKPRGKSSGRLPGHIPKARARIPVIKKTPASIPHQQRAP